VLARYAGRARLHLELKSEEQDLPAAVAELLERYGWNAGEDAEAVPGLTVTSFEVEQLYRSLQLLPEVPHGWLLRRITAVDVQLAAMLGLAEICPRAETLTSEVVAAAAAPGLRVRAWGVRNEDDVRTALEAGAVGATVNWPVRARDALEAP
jgi:glycerophosphoryl diester phosphodiesterase